MLFVGLLQYFNAQEVLQPLPHYEAEPLVLGGPPYTRPHILTFNPFLDKIECKYPYQQPSLAAILTLSNR